MDHPAGHLSHLVCRICGKQAADVRGLHKHIERSHQVDAWSYYSEHRDALRLRVLSTISPVIRVASLGECWEFQGRPGRNGYRTMRVAGAPTQAAHRLAFFAWAGYMPAPDTMMRHACDNPQCVRPEHLSPGSQLENMADRDERGRTIRGEDQHCSVLLESDIHEIRLKKSWGWANRAIARELGVSAATVDRVVNGVLWRHIPHDPAFDGDFIPW